MKTKKALSMKTTAVILAAGLLFGGAVGGTLAWLTDTTDTVQNTFSVGDVNIKLTETDTVQSGTDGVLTNSSFKIVPGGNDSKDPTVTVEKGSEACWVFVKIEEANNKTTNNVDAPKYVTWEIAEGWTEIENSETLPNGTYVYYKDQSSLVNASADATYAVLKGNTVSYDSDLTKTDLEAANNQKPSLTFTAYAIQKEEL